jgi:hypothetical protein
MYLQGIKEVSMVLDFNSNKLKFSLRDIGEYNLTDIYNNIERFKRFVNESVISDTFEKVFRTELFQITLADKNTCYLDNLLVTYNAIATTMLDETLPEITAKELKRQLLARGFTVKHTTRYVFSGIKENAIRVYKEERLW